MSRGGKGDHNIVLACADCNCDKGDMTVEEYRIILALRCNEFRPQFRAMLNEEAERAHTFYGEQDFKRIKAQQAWEDAQGEPDWKRMLKK